MRTPPHLRPQYSSDAERWADHRVIERIRAMDPIERLERMEDLNRAARELSLCNLRERYPDADEQELKLRVFARQHGRELSVRFFGWDPEIRGW